MKFMEKCPECGALGKIDEEQLQGKVSIICSECGNHDEREKYLEKLVKKADEMLEGMKEHFEELYKSGYYTKEQKRKIRKEGLIK
ncbi:unnamed protein product [marine sediment metagenome]|uniref:Uncharacterized protein n=1 Tax=marine sediment metagenome TaxID=412755 RepID=X1JQ16_9ZZZZ